MPPKGKAKAGAKAQARVAAEAAAEAPPVAAAPAARGPLTSLNGDLLELVTTALGTIQAHPMFDGIVGATPSSGIDAEAATHMAPFSEVACATALEGLGTYLAGGNFFWINHLISLTPGVPVSKRAIKTLIETHFKNPPKVFPEKLTVGLVDKAVRPADFGQLTRVSPEEVSYAFLLAMAEDLSSLQDDSRAMQWRACALRVPIEFVHYGSRDDLFWASVNIREAVGLRYATLYRSTTQRIFEIVNWKAATERATSQKLTIEAIVSKWAEKVKMSEMGEAITVTFVEAALSIWDRLLSDPECRAEVLACEERWGKKNPWDSVYKLEALIRKCGKQSDKSLANQRWALYAVSDGIFDGQLDSQGLSVRMLSGKGQPGGRGLVDTLLFKRSVLSYVVGTLLASLPLSQEEKLEICGMLDSHKAFREAFGFATKPKSRSFLNKYDECVQELILFLGEVVFGGTHDTNVKYCVKQSLSVEDFFGRAETNEKLEQVTAKIKDTRGDPNEPECVDIEDPSVGDHTIAMGFKLDAATGQEIVKQLDGQSDDIKAALKVRFERAMALSALEENEAELVQAYMKKATQKVLDMIELLPDQSSHIGLTRMLAQTYVGKVRGDDTRKVLVVFDAKVAGEAMTTPQLRMPPFKAERLKRCVQGVLACREDATRMHPGDLFIFFDAGNAGNKAAMLNQFLSPEGEPLRKDVKTLHLVYSEEALEKKYKRAAPGIVLNQLEHIHIISESPFQPPRKQRAHFSGCTTAGTVIGPTGLPDAQSQWLMSFADKKLLYGPTRSAIGGETPSVEHGGIKRKRSDTDFEPVSFHAMLPQVMEEILSSYPCKAVIDFTPMPDLPLACMKAKVPYVGICYTQEHATMLHDYLGHKVFSWMFEEGSPFYEADLAKTVKPAKKDDHDEDDKLEPPCKRGRKKKQPAGPKKDKDDKKDDNKDDQKDDKKDHKRGATRSAIIQRLKELGDEGASEPDSRSDQEE